MVITCTHCIVWYSHSSRLLPLHRLLCALKKKVHRVLFGAKGMNPLGMQDKDDNVMCLDHNTGVNHGSMEIEFTLHSHK